MNQLNTTYTDKWNLYSVDLISSLQSNFENQEWWLVKASVFGDNPQAFFFFFPLVCGLFNVVGARALWTAILVEWLNLLLKWSFKGDRPYWWINETPLYSSAGRPKLRQFANTCEAGPGTPSGHLMMNVAFFYVISRGILRQFNSKHDRYGLTKIVASSISLFVYDIWILLVFLSRLYIQSHFLHQCILGVIFGYLLGKYIHSNQWPSLKSPDKIKSVVFTLFIIGSSIGFYMALLNHGLDPLWSVPLAQKHCSKLTNVALDRQPYFLMVRFIAAAIGLRLVLSTDYKRKFMSTTTWGFLGIMTYTVLAVAAGQGLQYAQGLLPTDQVEVYYGASSVIFFLLPYIVIGLIPSLLYKYFETGTYYNEYSGSYHILL